MTREHAKQLLPIITAYANGETILLNGLDCFNEDLRFDNAVCDYSIKPPLAEYWIYGVTAHATPNAAGHAQNTDIRRGLKGGRIIHVIEVEE